MSDNMTTVPFVLPSDVIFDILSKLPVKTLIRFKSVSKAWYALIENPNFVKKHKEIQSNIEFDLAFSAILVISNGPGDTKKCRVLHFNEDSSKPIYSELPYLSNVESCEVVGICDGLACVSLCSDSSKLIICNPTTGHFRQVPPFKSQIRENDLIFQGFGLHDNGYELRMIIYSPRDDNSPIIRGEVYNMGTDIWTTIEVKLGKGHSLGELSMECGYHDNVEIDEIFYWKAGGLYDRRYIVSFDISKEVFDVMDVAVLVEDRDWQLLTIGGQLAMLQDHYLWVWNDMIWVVTSLCNLGVVQRELSVEGGQLAMLQCFPTTRESCIRVLGSTRKRELIVENRDEDSLKLLLYNLDSQKITCLRDVDVKGSVYYDYLCIESLTPVN